ncbi:hypothetical protein CFC35_00005 [Streptomyces sp. FBKL.4005]|nr:hypothetical protein CFC35_00005 [Streptomyces sp. FBKL.4005]
MLLVAGHPQVSGNRAMGRAGQGRHRTSGIGRLGVWTVIDAAASFPTHVFTAALLVVVCFWLVVAAGVADSACFDEDIDADAWGLGGIPVAASFSLMTAFAWTGSLCAALLTGPLGASWVLTALASGVVLAGAPLLAWWLTRALVRLLRRRHPDEHAPSAYLPRSPLT